MNIEWRIIENRDIQVNASLSPPPVWKMDLYLFMHDKHLLYTCDRYSLIWFTHKYCICMSHGNELPVLCQFCASTHSHPLNMKCVQCLDPEFNTANQYDCALLCNYTHNICTLHMLSWPRMRSDPVQNMNLCTHFLSHTAHIKMFWSAKSTNRCHMAALRRTKRYVLKQAHNRALPDWTRRHFQKLPSVKTNIVTSWV